MAQQFEEDVGTDPTDGAGVDQRGFGGRFLVGALRFLLLRRLLCVLLLGLDLLVPASHGSQLQPAGGGDEV